jgi:hypothetical protein
MDECHHTCPNGLQQWSECCPKSLPSTSLRAGSWVGGAQHRYRGSMMGTTCPLPKLAFEGRRRHLSDESLVLGYALFNVQRSRFKHICCRGYDTCNSWIAQLPA